MRILPAIAAAALPLALGACVRPGVPSQDEYSRRAVADVMDDAACWSHHLRTGTKAYTACRRRLAAERGSTYRQIP